MSSVDFEDFVPSEDNRYIYLETKVLAVSEWLILGAVLLSGAQICKISGFRGLKSLCYWEYWANYRLHRLWLYSLRPSNLWNTLHQKNEVYNAGKGPESLQNSMAVTCSILGAERRPLQLGSGASPGSQCSVRHQRPFQLSTAFAWLHLQLRLELARFRCSASYMFVKATFKSSQNHLNRIISDLVTLDTARLAFEAVTKISLISLCTYVSSKTTKLAKLCLQT